MIIICLGRHIEQFIHRTHFGLLRVNVVEVEGYMCACTRIYNLRKNVLRPNSIEIVQAKGKRKRAITMTNDKR
jgi:hypothetical protein